MNRVAKLLVVTGSSFISSLVGLWFAIGALDAPAHARVISISILGVLGLIVAIAVVWYLWPRTPVATSGEDDVGRLFDAAAQRLSDAPGLRGRKVRTIPAALILGRPNSGKTTVVARSPLGAGLLVGQVHGADDAAPPSTSGGNIWYADGALILEAGGSLLGDASRWPAFVRRFLPRPGIDAAFRGAQAPRSVVVCLSCEDLVAPNAVDAVEKIAGALHSAISDIAAAVGASVPVYVLFTKADKIPGFTEAVAGLTLDETREVLGATLSLATSETAGSYDNQQPIHLTERFARLCESLALDRLEMMSRGGRLEQRSLAFEFAREFRKVSPRAVQFLVRLCRPDPLRPSAFLRGFYFVGVRPIVDDAAVASIFSVAASMSTPVGVTAAFAGGMAVAERAVASSAGGRNRKPQWVFLDRLFAHIILADEARQLTTGGKRVDALRRWGLVAALVLVVTLVLGTTWSFRQNFALERRLDRAMSAVARLSVKPGETPSGTSLNLLDTLRRGLQSLGDGVPAYRPGLGLQWGLYSGDRVLEPARRVYFDAFDRLLLADARDSLARKLASLSNAAPELQLYLRSVEALKTYLIITDYPKRGSAGVGKSLTAAWLEGRSVAPADSEVAEAQFVHYASTLPQFNPIEATSDRNVLATAREFIKPFVGVRLYDLILPKLSHVAPAFFDSDVLGVLVDQRSVRGPYTRAGWTMMQQELDNIVRYTSVDQWVTGIRELSPSEQAKVRADVKKQYVTDYIAEWRTYLSSAKLNSGKSLAEAGQRIQSLASNDSPLLRLLRLASDNTNITGDTAISNPFRAVHAVVSGADLIGPQNQAYVTALRGLGLAAGSADGRSDADQLVGDAKKAADQVIAAVSELALKFPADKEGGINQAVASLLQSPADAVKQLLQRAGSLGDLATSFCAEFKPIAENYPFDSTGTDIPLRQFSQMFQPGGKLARFLNEQFQDAVERKGGRYVRRANARVPDALMEFINRMVDITNAFYAGGQKDPVFTFGVTPVFETNPIAITFVLEGETFRWQRATPDTRTATWRGASASAPKIDLAYSATKSTSVTEPPSPWALLHLLEKGARRTQGAAYVYSWDGPGLRIEPGPGQAVLSRKLFRNLECKS